MGWKLTRIKVLGFRTRCVSRLPLASPVIKLLVDSTGSTSRRSNDNRVVQKLSAHLPRYLIIGSARLRNDRFKLLVVGFPRKCTDFAVPTGLRTNSNLPPPTFGSFSIESTIDGLNKTLFSSRPGLPILPQLFRDESE
jgi:hypothetical protein